MLLTPNYRLRRLEGTDPVDVKDLGDNIEVIDKELAKKADKTGTASDMVTSFTQAASRTNITSGEKLSTSLGKIMKFFTDLKAVAFSGSYNDLSNKPTIPSGAAANYPVANNDTTNDAGYLVTAQVAYQHGREIDQINNDLGSRFPGGTGIQWDGTNFWGTTTSGVKKKLGEVIVCDAVSYKFDTSSAGTLIMYMRITNPPSDYSAFYVQFDDFTQQSTAANRLSYRITGNILTVEAGGGQGFSDSFTYHAKVIFVP